MMPRHKIRVVLYAHFGCVKDTERHHSPPSVHYRAKTLYKKDNHILYPGSPMMCLLISLMMNEHTHLGQVIGQPGRKEADSTFVTIYNNDPLPI